jgi:hypothetical protein
VRNDAKSEEAGRPVYEDVAFFEKWTPGDSTSIICRPARPNDKQEYAREWEQFQAKQEQKPDGTLLSELAFLTEGQRLEFAAVRCVTAEQLLAMPDNVAQKFAGINQIKQRVKAYLDAAAGNAPLLKLQSEIEARDARIAVLEEAVAELRKAKGK